MLPQDLQDVLADLETDPFFFEPEQLRLRLDALDGLDDIFGNFPAEQFMNDADARIHSDIKAIRARIEVVNTVLYESIRSEIVHGAPSHTLPRWFQGSASRDETASGLGYDYWDDVVSGVLQLREPREPRIHPLPEMVFYQPTPVRHILHLMRASALSDGDVFVDLGSGLGHVALLASMVTGVQSLGIEVEAAYVASAQECAQNLNLSRVRFIHKDARAADLSSGTVFYLYSPFTGSILSDVLDGLEKDSTRRPIKICALGPCTYTLATESWLKPIALPDPQQITVFQTRV
jgi:hypothetical protein